MIDSWTVCNLHISRMNPLNDATGGRQRLRPTYFSSRFAAQQEVNILPRPQRHLNLWRSASGKQHCYFIIHGQSGVGTYKFACGGDLYRLVKLRQNSLLHFTLSETCWWIWFTLGDLDQTGLFLCHPSMCTPSSMTWAVPEPLEHIDSYSDSEGTLSQIQNMLFLLSLSHDCSWN